VAPVGALAPLNFEGRQPGRDAHRCAGSGWNDGGKPAAL